MISGFQKSQQLALLRKEQKAELRAKIAPLNPSFPYAAESLDFARLGIPANPTKAS